MPDSTAQARFEVLCQAYLEDAISAEEATEFKALLSENPQWVERLVRDVKMNCLVRETLHEAHEVEQTDPDVIAQIAEAKQVAPLFPNQRSRGIQRQRKKRAGSMVLPAAVLLAACFVALVGVALLVLKQIQPQVAAEPIARLEGGSYRINLGAEICSL